MTTPYATHDLHTDYPARLAAPQGDRLLERDRPVLLPLAPGEPFDPLHTFRCGQVFRWHRHGDTWYGPFGQASLAVRVTLDGLEVRAHGSAVTVDDAWRFLGLDTPLAEVYRRLRPDPHLARAVEAAAGLRILRQDPWECVAGYICSQWNNIPKIELSTGRIARDWGTVHPWDGGVEVPVLPPPERLAELEPEALKSCALGYRCKYLVRTAQRVAAGEIDLPSLRRLPYREALAALLALPGIGRKVADCILLFSLDQPEAFPVDVWVRRVVHELYGEALSAYLPDAAARVEKGLTPREYDAILCFAWDRWGALAGYAQQYLFYTRRAGL
ncbi:MAG: DNA-3-methyladenine glycosylase family protein [Armatimonadota bacterium]